MKRLLLYVLVGWVIAAALTGCRATRPAATEPQRDYSRNEGTPCAPGQLTQRTPDSVVVQPHRSLLDKALGRKAKREFHALPTSIGKKSTVSVYYGPTTVTTNTAGKKAAAGAGATTLTKPDAPVATAAGDAVDNTKAGQRGGAAATGAGATATATTQKAGWPWWLYVLLAGLVGYACVRGYKRFTAV